VLPRKRLEYRDQILEEMDLDALDRAQAADRADR
jgi:K+-sensing histidine kinase KdpD